MIIVSQLNAQNTDPLTEEEVLALKILIRKAKYYEKNMFRFPRLNDRIAAEVLLPTVKTKGLKAVLVAAGVLPTIVVESQGSDKEPGFFSTPQNWEDLAQDALEILYDGEVSFVSVPSQISVIKKRLSDLYLDEHGVLILDHRTHRGEWW